jgi:hypothetical protein
MKNLNISTIVLFISFLFLFTGCAVIGDIFQAGMWVGIIGAVLVVALIIWIIRKLMG